MKYTDTQQKVKKLPEVVDSSYFKGVGIQGLWAKLVERTDTKAMYVRKDRVYEVFEIKVREATEIHGYQYPKQEMYPKNEDFGHWAWCYSGKDAYKRAKEHYDFLP